MNDRYAVEHTSRINRVIRQKGGHALLVGLGGSGRQSLAKLAAFIAGFDLFRRESNLLIVKVLPSYYMRRSQHVNGAKKKVR